MTAVWVHSSSENPEEEALKKITEYAKANGITQKEARLFGRNTYPTDAPEPHGYEYYLTVQKGVKPKGEISVKEVPGGLYAVLELKNLFLLSEGWKQLFTWVESNGHEPVGVSKGEHGWVNGAFEELVNWSENKASTEWIFRLWVQLKEQPC
jgi:DNA gyrase inhibitor GyrI